MFRLLFQRILSDVRWQPPPRVNAIEVRGVRYREMPRHPVRALLIVTLILITGVLGLLSLMVGRPAAYVVGNAAAKVRDPRHATQYSAQPLTAVVANRAQASVWVGSDGGGIKVYDSTKYYFPPDITQASTGGKLLSNHIRDLDLSPGNPALAAIVATSGKDGPGGVQLSSFGRVPDFWPRPLVDLSTFPGLTDAKASCIIASADGQWLILGTRGLGLGVYRIASHAWSPSFTKKDGLPSDTVNDLATVSGSDAQNVIWVATDQGICAGPVNAQGRFVSKWTYTFENGLAGHSVARMLVTESQVWYLTDGQGLGRISIDALGAPTGASPHQVLVTERSVPNLQDSDLKLAKGAPTGATWFLATREGAGFVGRYRETPHDMFGIPFPSGLALDAVACLAVEPESGKAAFIGTRDGGWFFGDDVTAADNSRAGIIGGFAQLKGIPIAEAAISRAVAVVKTRTPESISYLQRAVLPPEYSGPSKPPAAAPVEPTWNWNSLIGAGRFPGLANENEVTAVAGIERKLYFGTRGKGIGTWDRDAMEVRQAMHSTFPGGQRLRDDTTLDLAAAGNVLIQVTGDHAVDTFVGGNRTALVPPDTAPMAKGDIVSATARGTFFACASVGKVAIYDMATFHWTELPGLSDIARLEVSGSRLWALTGTKDLFFTPIGGETKDWVAVASNVQDLAASLTAVYVLLQPTDLPAAIHVFDDKSTKGKPLLSPHALPATRTAWRFAAIVGDDLLLVGDDSALHRYVFAERSWSRLPFPGSIAAPIAAARRTTRGFWLVDRERVLHCYDLAKGEFQEALERGVERIQVCEDAVVVLSRQPAGDRLVIRTDGQAGRRVLVGREFEGNLALVSDALEWRDNLVVAQEEKIGFFDWRSHSWTTFDSAAGPIARFYTAGDALWAMCGNVLHVWADQKMTPVLYANQPLRPVSVSADQADLVVLDNDGRVLAVSATAPGIAELRLAADRLQGGLPATAAAIGLLQSHLVVVKPGIIQTFGPVGLVNRWTRSNFTGHVSALFSDPAGERLVGHDESKAWILTRQADGGIGQKEIFGPTGSADVLKMVGVAAGATESVSAVRVGNEIGARVWSRSTGLETTSEVIGPALNASAATRAVLRFPETRGLMRLDAAGRVGLYTTDNRGWKVDLEQSSLETIWKVESTPMGYSRTEKSLYLRGTSGWTREETFRGRVERVAAFSDGLVLELTDGGLAWHNGLRGRLVRDGAKPRNGPGELGRIVAAVEHDGMLVLIGTNQRLAAFDWAAQSWVPYYGGPVDDLVNHDGHLYLLQPSPAGGKLAGPLERHGGALAATAIAAPAALKAAVASPVGIFCLGSDRAIYRLEGESLVRCWGGASAAPAGNLTGLVGVERRGAEFWLLTDSSDGRATALKVNASTLESQARVLPLGQLKGLRRFQGELYAELATPKGTTLVDLRTGQLLAPPLRNAEFLVEGDSLWACTPEGMWSLEGALWWLLPPGLETVSRGLLRVPNVVANSLASASSLMRVGDGAWSFPPNPPGDRIDWFVDGVDTRGFPAPATGRMAFAHEFVNGIIPTEDGLMAATEGGLVELKMTTDTGVATVRILRSTEGLPRGGFRALERVGKPMGENFAGTWFGYEGGRWRPMLGPSNAEREKARREHCNAGDLRSWRFATSGDSAGLERSFPVGGWRATRLGAEGFEFESYSGAEIARGSLLVFTTAGTLVFASDKSGVEPDDLRSEWRTPPGFGRGMVGRGFGDMSFLSPSGNPAEAGRETVFLRGESQWRAATAADKLSIETLASAPFLADAEWRWERSDRVEWKSSDGGALSGVFSPRTGRFGWDTCLAIGQAQGQVWILTDAGLLRVRVNRVENSSLVPLRFAAEQLSFRDVSGVMPGVLQGADGNPRLVFQDRWRAPSEVNRASLDDLSQYRVVNPNWRVRRDAGLLRAVPQEPGRFVAVKVGPDGRWDFETVADLAAREGTCYLATAAGLATLRGGAIGLQAWWPEMGVPEAVGMVQGKAIARVGNRSFENDRLRWISSTFTGPLHPPTLTSEGKRWRVVRRYPGVAFEVKRSAPVAFAPIEGRQGRFAFDDLFDAALRSASGAAASSAEGLIEYSREGDFSQVTAFGIGPAEKLEFFRVEDDERSTLLARGAGGQFLAFREGWETISAEAGSRVWALSQTRLAVSRRWQVTKPADGAVDVRLHLDGDPRGVFKSVAFDGARGLFKFDVLRAIAPPDASGHLLLGSEAGPERVNETGLLERLWCSPDTDGWPIGTQDGVITGAVRDEAGTVQFEAGVHHAQLNRTTDRIELSTKAKFDTARALKAADPNGWRVEINRGANLPLEMSWGGEPVFLVDVAPQRARFAHNLVHAALMAGQRLVLATSGGIMVMASERKESRASMRLFARPFGVAVSGRSELRLEVFGWLGLYPGNAEICAVPLSESGPGWKIPLADITRSAVTQDTGPARQAVRWVDRVLEWRHPKAGTVEARFVQGRSTPDRLVATIAEGTFTFLNLEVPRVESPSSTLVASPDGIFCATRGGVIRFALADGEFAHISRETANRAEVLTDVAALLYGLPNGVVYARRAGVRLRFDPNAGTWSRDENTVDPFASRALVNSTPMLEWWQEAAQRVRVRRKHVDVPQLPFLQDGRPAMDRINDLAFAPDAGGQLAMLATQTGVAELGAAGFEYRRLQVAAFRLSEDFFSPVRQIAAVPTLLPPWRIAARTNDTRSFEFSAGAWRTEADVTPIFEASYCCVSQPEQWLWSRYPTGLTCTILHTNGPDLRLGGAVDPSLPDIFSRGKMALDDIRGALITASASELLAVSPLGIIRYGLLPGRKTGRYVGLDAWATTTDGGAQVSMTGLTGIERSGGTLAWSERQMFANQDGSRNGWSLSPERPAALAERRVLQNANELWEVQVQKAPSDEIKVVFGRGEARDAWYLPVENGTLRDVATSSSGLWFISGNELFLVDRARVQRAFDPSHGSEK